jgi:hypothetical protein
MTALVRVIESIAYVLILYPILNKYTVKKKKLTAKRKDNRPHRMTDASETPVML